MSIITFFILVLIGIAAGLLSGMVGVGGGIIMVPLFVFLLGYTQHGAQGMSLAVMLPPVTFLAVYNYQKTGELDWKMALVVSVAFVVAGYFGSKFAMKINEVQLKKIFGFVMLFAAIKLIFFSSK